MVKQCYSLQTLDVIAELYSYEIYRPKWECCEMLLTMSDVAEGYIWIVNEYNRIKQTDYFGPLVWWNTDYQEALDSFKRVSKYRTDIALITANIPEKYVLLHDADLWEEGPLCGWPLGFRASNSYCNNEWTAKEDKFFNDSNAAYEKNRRAAAETWRECLIITKNTARIHALTPFIDKTWFIKKMPNIEASENPMEM